MTPALTSLGLPGQIMSQLSGTSGRRSAKSATPSSKATSFNGAYSGAVAAGAITPQAQLVALINNGTPISTIIDQLSNQIADAVQQRLPASQVGSGASRTALVNSIKTALSPPANAPPGSAADQVAALGQRLQRWLEGLSEGTNQQNGQQNDISGKVLDANSAREIPAQTQGSKTTPASTGLVLLANSLLASVAAALSGRAPVSTAAPKPSVAANQITIGTAQTTTAPAPAPASNAAASAPSTAVVQTAAASSAQTPGDLVARMIIRAAGADAQRNADLATAQSAAPAAQLARSATPAPASTSSSQSMTEKMTMLLTEAISAAAGSSQERASAQDDALGDPSSNAADSGAPQKAVRTDLSAFSLPSVPSPVTSASSQSQTASTANPPADPSAAVEQLIASMTMHTSTDGTSQVRLRLQPESLGTVTLKLTVDGNNVSANVVAQTGEARTALLAGQQHLARSLADSGLKLTSFTVDVSGGQTHDQNRDQTSGFGRKYTVHEAAATDADSPDSSSVGPELLSGSTLGLLSYLA